MKALWRRYLPGTPEYGGDGFVYASERPGLGVDINEEAAAKYPCRVDVPTWTQTRNQDGSLPDTINKSRGEIIMLRSQKVRELAPEMDPLRLGMGWKLDDLEKPQILIESTYGNSHPGSSHLNRFVEEAVKGVDENGGKAARYFATDMCDGMGQGHDGINYSLAHRDAIVNLVEVQANATTFDGGVFIASCDKAMPAMLMSIGRLKEMSAIMVTGGVMEAFAPAARIHRG